MRRLTDLRHLEKKQYDELTSLLQAARIAVHETTTNFMGYGAIWVRDEDFPRAVAILRTEAVSFAARARKRWDRQWQTEYKSSHVRWFAHKLFRSPVGTVVQVLLLAALVGVFVVYPLLYVLRRAI